MGRGEKEQTRNGFWQDQRRERFPIERTSSFFLVICYAAIAILSVYFGLIVLQNLLAVFVIFHLAVCVGIPLFHRWKVGDATQDWSHGNIQPGRNNAGAVIAGVASGLVLFAGAVFGIGLLFASGVATEQVREVLVHWGLTSQWLWAFAAYMILFNSLLEESFWRGFVQKRLGDYLGKAGGIALTSFFFALYHFFVGSALFGWMWGGIFTLFVFVAGLWWGWLMQAGQVFCSIWISHLLADAGLMITLVVWVY